MAMKAVLWSRPTAFALLVLLAVPAAWAQDDADDADAVAVRTYQVAGTILVDGQPVSGEVRLDQWSAAHEPVHSDSVQAGEDGRFALEAWAGAPTTNLVAFQGPDLYQTSLGRLQGDFDFEWPLVGSLGDAPVRFEVAGADGGQPGPAVEGQTVGPTGLSLVVMDGLHPGRYYCIGKPGEPGPSQDEPTLSGSPPRSSANAGPPCPLTWTAPGVAEGRLPRGLVTFVAEDLNWQTCNWSMQHPDACLPYLPFSSAAGIPEGGADVQVRLERAKPADARIEGYYLSEVTGRPLARKSLSLTDGEVGIAVTTDDDGSFRVGLPAGTYEVSANLCGHGVLDVTVALVAGSPLRQDFVQPAETPSEADGGSSGGGQSDGPHVEAAGPRPTYPTCEGSHAPRPGSDGTDPRPEPASPVSPSTGPAPEDATLVSEPDVASGALVLRYEGLGPIDGKVIADKPVGGNELTTAKPDRGMPVATWVVGLSVAIAALVRRKLA